MYTITVTKNDINSNDPSFESSYYNLNGHPDKSQRPKIKDYFFETSDGDRVDIENHRNYAAVNLYRLGLKVFYDRLKNFSDDKLLNIKTHGYDKKGSIGLWRNEQLMRETWGHSYNSGSGSEYINEQYLNRFPENKSTEGLSFYNCGMYDSLIGCQELLKVFNDDGKFIVKYTRGREEHNGDNMNKSAKQTLSLQEFTNILKIFTETAQAKIYYKSILNEKYHYPDVNMSNNDLSLYYGNSWKDNISKYENLDNNWFERFVKCMHFCEGNPKFKFAYRHAQFHITNPNNANADIVVEIGFKFNEANSGDQGADDNFDTIRGYYVHYFPIGNEKHNTKDSQIEIANDKWSEFDITQSKEIYNYVCKLLNNIEQMEEYMPDNKSENITNLGQNIIYYGVPGTGKSYKIEREWGDNPNKNSNAEDGMIVVERTVFHPEYDNTDFVGQLLPVTTPTVTYEFTPGPFARILARAIVGEVQKDKRQYNLIIEEINRGNAAAIFGEIFQLLDREDNYEINNKQIADYVLGEVQKVTNDENKESLTETIEKLQQGKVWLPSNLNIIASMNTSDQNVFTLDNAFQRRFEMRRLPNNFASDDISGIKDTKIANTGILWGDFRDIINNQIVQYDNSFSSEDKLIGPHFVTPNDLKNTDAFTGKVIKYLWQDVCRMQPELLFANDIKSLQGIYDKIDSGKFTDVFNDNVKKELTENNADDDSRNTEAGNESNN